ncbi:MAG: NUDIX hydrolase [Cyanobacteriota bacterium]|nr:NUDIX hydrolase [Cyanobacteriota bacterium]
MPPATPQAHGRLAIEAELSDGPCRFVRERLRLPMGMEASFGWLRHPPTVLVVPRCADGGLLLIRQYRPAVGRWVLEFPSGIPMAEESPEAGSARLVRQLTGFGGGSWRQLGTLWPNPGYSDERMTVGLMEMAGADAGEPDPITFPQGNLWELRRYDPQALEAALMGPGEAVDGRSVSAWFLARPHWSV